MKEKPSCEDAVALAQTSRSASRHLAAPLDDARSRRLNAITYSLAPTMSLHCMMAGTFALMAACIVWRGTTRASMDSLLAIPQEGQPQVKEE